MTKRMKRALAAVGAWAVLVVGYGTLFSARLNAYEFFAIYPALMVAVVALAVYAITGGE